MIPDARNYDPRPEYLAELVGSLPHTQTELAAKLGVTDRCLRQWLSGARQFPYTAQFALECLVLQV
jgi:DNA-binding transcriptional regulator YdaS (Cro superfamily)